MSNSVRFTLAAAAVLAAAACSKKDGGPPASSPIPDTTPPVLIDRNPALGADNIWAFAPISMTFSEKVAEASFAPALFEVRADGEAAPLPAEIKLTEDRRTVNVRLTAALTAPVGVTMTVKSGLRDDAGNIFEGASWSWTVPLWHDAGAALREGAAARSLTRPTAAVDRQGVVMVAWEESGGDKGALGVSRLTETGWVRTPAPDKQLADSDAVSPRLTAMVAGFALAWLERGSAGSDVQVRLWSGDTWNPLGTLPADGPAEAESPTIFADDAGSLLVAWVEGQRQIKLAGWELGAWKARTKPYVATGIITSYELAIDAGRPVLAVVEKGTTAASADLTVHVWDNSALAWQPLGTALDRLASDEVSNPALAIGPKGALGITWQEHDGASDHVYAARFDGDWKLLGPALDLDIDAAATSPRMQFAPSGEPVVAWREGPGSAAFGYVARFEAPRAGAAGALPGSVAENGRWVVLGGFQSVAGPDAALALTLDERGHPSLVDLPAAAKAPGARRWNGTPRLAFGLPPRSGPPGCTLPDEKDPSFPRTLAATGCYTNLTERKLAAGALPYDVVSPLWSDGSLKRRFIVLPEGKSFTYKDYDSWETPPGTIFIKEFILEAAPGNPGSRTPMETRLLVKRCEEGECEMPWQGYSYQWNDASTDAVLLTNAAQPEYKDWKTATGTHRHTYPGQNQCGQCHLLASGGTLGIQASQLNRSFNYGGGVVDNQLRALGHAGAVKRASADADFLPTAPRVPAPHDVSFSLERRVRGYFQGNCGHCHRPGGAWPVMDFRYHLPLAASRLCQIITPGDSARSRLYIKSSTRDVEKLPDGTTGRPMPPLGSLLLDERQLALLRGWIDGLKTCP